MSPHQIFREKSMRTQYLALAIAALTLVGPHASAQVTVPNTFVAGAAARAADVNANFQALATAINGLAARVAKTEGQVVMADLVGTYALSRMQTEIGVGRVANYISGGTLTMAANGTATLSGLTERGNQLNLVGTGSLITISRTDPAVNLTWSYTGGKVVFDGVTPLSVADGGRLLISTQSNTADGTAVLLLFVRTN